MNIDEFRALKAQEVSSEDSLKEQPSVETKNEPTENIPSQTTETTNTEATPPQTNETPLETKLDKVFIDGVGEVDIEELKKGYLRASDYTRKTQMVANQRKEAEEALKLLEAVKSNPQLAQEIAIRIQNPNLDPTTSKIIELENRIYDLMLENEIKTLQNKYPDFEPMEVIEMAQKKRIVDLEDAYHLVKAQKTPVTKETSSIDVESLKKQLREEILKELDSNKDTRTVITTGGSSVVNDNTPKISDAEKKVAMNMFRNEKDPIGEYIKWRDKKV